jgi:predicted RNase H-like nuclease (RuvC/YqgF family)
MTILTTASNLEDLIEAKPTARGQVLSRFLGLEFLKKKEETAKEIYSDFSKGMMSNVYNTESLKQQIDTSKEEIGRLQKEIETADKQMEDVDSIYVKLKEEKRRLEVIQKKNTMEKSRIKDSIMKIERLKAKEEKLKIKELYEKQLDNIPNYRGCDIDTFKVEIK